MSHFSEAENPVGERGAQWWRNCLVCPDCRSALGTSDGGFVCDGCGRVFPHAGDTPVLRNSDSVFASEQAHASGRTYYADRVSENPLKRRVRRALPSLITDWHRTEALTEFRRVLDALPAPRHGLVVGAGEVVAHVPTLYPEVEWMTTDVIVDFGVDVVADVTGLPLTDAACDVIFIDQVLEHVIDMSRAASELQRILRTGGVLFVGIPFNYPWHGAPLDFFRTTPSGIRSLFRSTEIVYLNSGAGPWSAIAKQLLARSVSSFRNRWLRRGAVLTATLVLWPLKYLDRWTRDNDVETAASMTFIGRKIGEPITPAVAVEQVREWFSTGGGPALRSRSAR